jgi:hypothetical protein
MRFVWMLSKRNVGGQMQHGWGNVVKKDFDQEYHARLLLCVTDVVIIISSFMHVLQPINGLFSGKVPHKLSTLKQSEYCVSENVAWLLT